MPIGEFRPLRQDVQGSTEVRKPLPPLLRFAEKKTLFEERRYGINEEHQYTHDNQILQQKVTEQIAALAHDAEQLGPHYQSLGLDTIATTGDLEAKIAELPEAFDALSPQDRFAFLIRMRKFNHTGLELLSHTNAYLWTEESLRASDLPGTKPEELVHEQLHTIDTGSAGSNVDRRRLPDFYAIAELREMQKGKGIRGEDIQLTFDEEVRDIVAEYLPYKEVVLHDVIYEASFPHLLEKSGKDALTGEFIVKKVLPKGTAITPDEAVRLSTPLPEALQEWKERGLFDTACVPNIIDGEKYLYGMPGLLRNLAGVFLPEGKSSVESVLATQRRIQDLQRHLVGSIGFDKSERVKMEISWLQEERDRLMLDVQREFFEATVSGLEQSDIPLHPLVERKVPEVILHSISGGSGKNNLAPWLQAYEDEKNADPNKDTLAAFVPWVKRYAYQIGVFTDPLIDEMHRRGSILGYDSAKIATAIEDAMKMRETDRAYQPEAGAMNWFIEEALDVVSTVDDAGGYDPALTKYIPLATPSRRSPLIIEDIVERLKLASKDAPRLYQSKVA